MPYQFGDYVVDTATRQLGGSAGGIHVEPQVFAVLDYLLANRDRVVSRDELTQAVWRADYVSDATLNSRIKAARAAIGDDGASQALIKTFRGVGYRFVGDVEVVGENPGRLPRVRYTTTDDGCSLAYQVFGAGDNTVMWITGSASHLEVFWKIPAMAHAFERLAANHRVITMDKRGCGLSDRTPSMGTLERRADDVRCVIDAAGADQVVLFTSSEAGASGMQTAVRHSDRIKLLLLASTYATSFREAWSEDEFRAAEEAWGSGSVLRGWWFANAADQMLPTFGEYERLMSTPRHFGQMLRETADVDARHLARQIAVPTAVIHSVSDPVVPLSAGQWLADNIEGATLTTFDGPFHGPGLISDVDLVLDVINAAIDASLRGVGAAAG